METVNIYTIELVKEQKIKYNLDALNSPDDVARFAINCLRLEKKAEEYMYMIAVTAKNQIAGVHRISQGVLDTALVHPREIYKRALLNNAAGIVLIHNHPSGNPTPSGEDIKTTGRIKEVGQVIGIPLLDHIIIGEGGTYVSLARKKII